MPRRADKAFTLIEVLAVVMIMALAAGAVSLRLHGAQRRTEREALVAEVGQFDALARHLARRQGEPVSLLWDLEAGRLERIVEDNAGRRTLELPAGCEVGRMYVGGRRVEGGSASVRISAAGLSPSYALRLDAPGGSRWLLVAGLTGEITGTDSEAKVTDILTTAAGPDAR